MEEIKNGVKTDDEIFNRRPSQENTFYIYELINRCLSFLGKSSLYELLEGSTPENTPEELRKMAVEKYNDFKNIYVHGVSKELSKALNCAMRVFADEKSKREYDEYLATREFVWDELELINKYCVDAVDYTKYINWITYISKALDISYDEAEKRLLLCMSYYKITVIGQ